MTTTCTEDDFRRNNPRFQGENFAQNLELVERVRGDRAREGRHAGAARARLGARPGADVVPIPGTKRVRYLEENVGAVEIELSAADLRRLDGFPKGAIAGDRYADMTRSTATAAGGLAGLPRAAPGPRRRRLVGSA